MKELHLLHLLQLTERERERDSERSLLAMASSPPPPPPPPHVVVLPFAQQGHINPLVQLAKKLAAHGFTITFVLSENTVPENPNPSPNLTFAGVPDLLPPERSRGSVFRDSVDSMTNMEPGFRDFIHRLHHSDHPVTAIITDVFMIWCYGIAAELSIPCLTFFTSNATAASVFDHVPSLVDMGVLPFPRGKEKKKNTSSSSSLYTLSSSNSCSNLFFLMIYGKTYNLPSFLISLIPMWLAFLIIILHGVLSFFI